MHMYYVYVVKLIKLCSPQKKSTNENNANIKKQTINSRNILETYSFNMFSYAKTAAECPTDPFAPIPDSGR